MNDLTKSIKLSTISPLDIVLTAEQNVWNSAFLPGLFRAALHHSPVLKPFPLM